MVLVGVFIQSHMLRQKEKIIKDDPLAEKLRQSNIELINNNYYI